MAECSSGTHKPKVKSMTCCYLTAAKTKRSHLYSSNPDKQCKLLLAQSAARLFSTI